MSLPENPVLAGAKWRMMGTQVEGEVGCGGDVTVKAAEADCQGVGDEGGTDNVGSHLELLSDLGEPFKHQLKELRGLRQSMLMITFTMDEVVEWMLWMEEGSGSGNDGVRSL